MTLNPGFHPHEAESMRTDASYEEAVFAWMAEWQPDVRVLVFEKQATETEYPQ